MPGSRVTDKPKKPPVENEDPAYFCMSGLSPDRLQVAPDSRTLLIFKKFRLEIRRKITMIETHASWAHVKTVVRILTRNR